MRALPRLSVPPGTDAPVRIAVLFGGQSEEHSISCLSAAAVLAALDRDRYDVTAIGICPDGSWYQVSSDPGVWRRQGDTLPVVQPVGGRVHLEELRVDVVFPVLHGPRGEDGTVQGALDLLGIPYVGSGVLASALTMDKHATKRMLGAYGIAVGSFVSFDARAWRHDQAAVVARIIAQLQFPVFVKPNRMGSSIGISKVADASAVVSAVTGALRHDSQVIVEQSIEGAREIECGVLAGLGHDGPVASVTAEIVVGGQHEFYDFTAKYIDGSSQLVVPADIPEVLHDEIAASAVSAFTAAGCDGLARVDYFLGRDGDVTLNEINTMPGFTNMSMFPRMWEASGLAYSQVVDHLVSVALERSK